MATVSGTVLDENSNPTQKLVRAYERDRGVLVGVALSDPITGAWSITDLKPIPHFATVTDVSDANLGADSVRLYVPMDSGGFVDLVGNPITVTGAVINSTQYKFGAESGYFNGSASINFGGSVPRLLPGQNFTVQGWYRPTALGNYATLYSGAAAGSLMVSRNGVGNIGVGRESLGFDITASSAIALDQWTHIAAVRNSGTLTLYFNGVSVGSAANTVDYAASTAGSIGYNYTGHVCDLAVSLMAEYTAPFSAPTLPFKFKLAPPTRNARIFDNITPV
jgi:hypothetical protein